MAQLRLADNRRDAMTGGEAWAAAPSPGGRIGTVIRLAGAPGGRLSLGLTMFAMLEVLPDN